MNVLREIFDRKNRIELPHIFSARARVCATENGAKNLIVVNKENLTTGEISDARAQRVQRCVIHYPVPDGRIIPFCAMNTLHRQEIEKMFARPSKESTITARAA